MDVFYNEWDEPTAAWLRELGARHHLPAGHVDTRSIRDVRPDDVRKFDQAHWFAGIGGWPLALKLAGHERLPCWTGSPPCQPFSIARQQRGIDDERHLAPAWLDLIRECRPVWIFGEQVADAIRVGWLDDLFDALEDCGYACGAAVLPACGVGAPHIRKRLFFGAVRLADADGSGQCERWRPFTVQPEQPAAQHDRQNSGAYTHHGGWAGADWLGCRDGKFRPVEPLPQQVVDGFSCGLGPMCDHIAQEIIKDMDDATGSYSDTQQAVCDLWMQYAAEAVQWPSGRLVSFQSPQVLLALMRELTRKGWKLGNHLLPTCWESAEDGLREMRRSPLAPPRSPHIGGPFRQPIPEPPNTLSVLSQAISYAARKWAVNRDPLNMEADKRDHRVGRLRGYGNAIVPQVAAGFIQEFIGAVEQMLLPA